MAEFHATGHLPRVPFVPKTTVSVSLEESSSVTDLFPSKSYLFLMLRKMAFNVNRFYKTYNCDAVDITTLMRYIK